MTDFPRETSWIDGRLTSRRPPPPPPLPRAPAAPAAPVALATDSTFLSFPVDMGLAVMFPLHGHIGMNYVITDYVPKLLSKAAVGPARAIMVGVTGATMLGLTKLNVEGPGITGTLKALWRKPKE